MQMLWEPKAHLRHMLACSAPEGESRGEASKATKPVKTSQSPCYAVKPSNFRATSDHDRIIDIDHLPHLKRVRPQRNWRLWA